MKLITGTGKDSTSFFISFSAWMLTSGEAGSRGWGAAGASLSGCGWARIRERQASVSTAKEKMPLNTFRKTRQIFFPRPRTPAPFRPAAGQPVEIHFPRKATAGFFRYYTEGEKACQTNRKRRSCPESKFDVQYIVMEGFAMRMKRYGRKILAILAALTLAAGAVPACAEAPAEPEDSGQISMF